MYQEPITQLKLVSGRAMPDRIRRKSGKFGKYASRHDMASELRCESRGRLQLIANQMLSVQENERKRIATDLHDGLGQSLTMIKLSLTGVAMQLANGAIDEATESLQKLKISVHNALEEVRHVAMDLRPPMLDDLGLLPTLSWFFREFEAVCPGMKVEKNIDIHEGRIPDALKITIFRILQESSSNIVKYAHANLMRVTLKQVGNTLCFLIEDNGNGFDPAEVAARKGSDHGLGLLSMKERAMLSGGVYVMESVSGKGTQIRVTWPLESSDMW